MKLPESRPPRLAVLLLETLLPAESRDVVVGDLVEAYESRVSQSRPARWLFFWRETLGALAQLQRVPEHAAAFTPYPRESAMQPFLSDVRRAAADSTVSVAIVSSALARRIWPGENAIGKYIRLGGPDGPWRKIIGIAGDIRHTGLDATETLQAYVPERQWQWAGTVMALVVRTTGDPAGMAGVVRDAVRSVDPLQPIAKVATMDQVIARSTAQRRLGLLLFAAFSSIALVLAFVGIYGVLAGSVAERTREFGLRSAMGATPGAIIRLVLGQAGQLAGIGIVIGIAGALALSGYVRALLYGIEPTDPVTAVLAIAAIAGIALAACLIPARRAVRVDPMVALRAE